MASSAQNKQNSASLSSAEAGEILIQRSERVSTQRELATLRERREFYTAMVNVAKNENEDYQDACLEVDSIDTEIDSLNTKLRQLG